LPSPLISSKPYIETDSADVIALGQIIGSGHVDELTSASSVITETEIAARGQQYISDLLRSLPGIAVNTSGPGGGLTQIRVRGSEANHVLVLIDGVEVANPSSGEFDFSGLRAEDVVRVETLRGEQSALYGSVGVPLSRRAAAKHSKVRSALLSRLAGPLYLLTAMCLRQRVMIFQA